MCANVFTALFVLKGQIFVGLALFLAKIVVLVTFTGLAQIIPRVKLVGGLIWTVIPGLFARLKYSNIRMYTYV